MLGAASFWTYLIVCPTSFILGILFTNWSYDFPLLWTSKRLTPEMIKAIEAHYVMLYDSPPLIGRVLHAIILIALAAFIAKLYKPSESNALFDGASLVLFMVAVIVYGSNTIKGMQIIKGGDYGEDIPQAQSLQVVAASNTIMALVLIGVLLLQAGQWYAERKEKEELDAMSEGLNNADSPTVSKKELKEKKKKV
ncbi:hypothetical protein H072_4655 [Dactylellina haptotyla CBS 200.50]|uniref:ER membrane protein SH3 n=1 Tax=Dactylellina haptotyla (strain CBS 200.50) TaxID=1284197 RepID=S8AEY5_DACHA|nr:hypothetical protein H072_4655 [Dactylellina haptotyla CBS 200.50]